MARVSRAVRAGAVAAAVFLTCAARPAAATALSVNNFVSTADGSVFRLIDCTGPGCARGQFSLTPGLRGVTITGAAGNVGAAGPIESIASGGVVDTFLEFAISSPITSITSLSVSVTGCGDNPGVAGCKASNADASASTTVITSADQAAAQVLASTAVLFGAADPNTRQVTGTQTFAGANTIYVRMDLLANSNAQLLGPPYGFASFDQVALAFNVVPEPASGGLLAVALAAAMVLRRRRRA